MNITRNIQAPSTRDFQEYQARLRALERAPLAERKENAREWFNDLKDPSLIADRIDWLLDGSYGYTEYWKALQVLESPRMNRVAALSIMVAALEWNTPQQIAIAAWKQLTPKQQTDLKMKIDAVISDHVDKWLSKDEGGKYEGRCGGAYTPSRQFTPERYKYVIPVQATVFKQDINGNTYHQVKIYDNGGHLLYDSGRTYGYGSAYEDTAYSAMMKIFKLPKKYRDQAKTSHGTYPYLAFRAARDDKYLLVDINVEYSSKVR
jgi:hypothetical protein